MKIEVSEKYQLVLREVFNSIRLETDSPDYFTICMRDGGFEFTYAGKKYEAKNGKLKEIKQI